MLTAFSVFGLWLIGCVAFLALFEGTDDEEQIDSAALAAVDDRSLRLVPTDRQV